MARVEDSFRFPPELGTRLRELRKRRTKEITRTTSNPKQALRVAQWFSEVYGKWRPKWEKA